MLKVVMQHSTCGLHKYCLIGPSVQNLIKMLHLSSQKRDFVEVRTAGTVKNRQRKPNIISQFLRNSLGRSHFNSIERSHFNHKFCFFQSSIFKLQKDMHYFEDVIISINQKTLFAYFCKKEWFLKNGTQ